MFEESIADERLIELKHEIAELDARRSELHQRLDTGESGATWKALVRAVADYRCSESHKDEHGKATALKQVFMLIEKGHSDTAQWEEIQQVIELRMRLASAEDRRAKTGEEYIAAKAVVAVFVRIYELIAMYVENVKQRNTLIMEIERLIAKPGE